MSILITTEVTENDGACLICETKHTKGFPIFPLPQCSCSNVIFDINSSYVRMLIKWPYVKVHSKNNWKKRV